MKKEGLLLIYSKYKQFIFPAVVVLSSLILVVVVILPQTIKLVTNQKVGSDLLDKSSFLEVKAKDLESLDENDLSRKINYALNTYPADKDFGQVIGIIQKIVDQNGFTIRSLNIGGGFVKGGSQSYTISLQLLGPKFLFAALLNNFENAPRLMNVDVIEISRSAGDSVEVSLGLSVLFAPLPQNFGNVDSPLPKLSQKEEELIVTLAGVQEQPAAGVSGGETIVSVPKGKANPFE